MNQITPIGPSKGEFNTLNSQVQTLSDQIATKTSYVDFGTVAAGSSTTITFPSDVSKIYLCFTTATADTRLSIWYIVARSSGQIIWRNVLESSYISISAPNDDHKLTVSNSGSGAVHFTGIDITY